MNIIEMKRKGYGYETENPIKAFGARASYDYLNSIKSKEGHIIKCIRDHSCGANSKGHIIDCYFVYVLVSHQPLTIKKYELFIDMYNYDTDDLYPEDFEKFVSKRF